MQCREIGDRLSAADDAEARIGLRETAQEIAQIGIEQAPGHGASDRLLQRLEAVENEQRALLADQLGEAQTLARARGIVVAEEAERLLEEVAHAAGAGGRFVAEGAG